MSHLFHKLLAPMQHATGDFGRRWRATARAHTFTVVLCYHRVVAKPESNGLSGVEAGVSAATFERQIRFMLRHFDPIPPSEVLSPGAPGAMRFTVTFDDGYADNYTVAAPILRRLGVSAGFFVVQDFIASDQRFWWEQVGDILRRAQRSQLALTGLPAPIDLEGPSSPDSLPVGSASELAKTQAYLTAALIQCPHREIDTIVEEIAVRLATKVRRTERDFPLMDWQQIKTLMQQGFEIGGHTATHANLGSASHDELDREVVHATERLEAELGEEVRIFAYPYGSRGHWSEDSICAIRNTRIRVAFTTELGIVSPSCSPWLAPRVQLNRERPFVWAYNIDKAMRAGVH